MWESVDLSNLIRAVLSDLQIRIEQTDAEIEVGDLPTIEGNTTQLRQLCQNLIGNALKFVRPDVPPRIQIQSELLTDNSHGLNRCKVTIQDNGIGIKAEHLDRIFGVFERLHGREHYEGTGIGLATCKKIVNRHGGNIWVESEVGKGSTFFFTIPIPKLLNPNPEMQQKVEKTVLGIRSN